MEKQIDMEKIILGFNETKDYNLFLIFLEKKNISLENCIKCNKPVIYYDTKIGIRNQKIKGKSNLSKKIVNGNTYRLCVCEKCLIKKFKEYDSKNKTRVFNQMNEFTKYAFNINEVDYKKQRDMYVLIIT